MEKEAVRYAPGKVRDAIMQVMSLTSKPLSVKEIESRVKTVMGPTPNSSIRSYLRLNTPEVFVREGRGEYRVRSFNGYGVQRELATAQECGAPRDIRKVEVHSC